MTRLRSPHSIIWGTRIGQLRRAAGITQTQLAEAIGASQGAVSHWESGNAPSDIYRPRLARALGTTTAELFDYEDEPGNGDTEAA